MSNSIKQSKKFRHPVSIFIFTQPFSTAILISSLVDPDPPWKTSLTMSTILSIPSNKVELFGGAITCLIADSLFDASTLRQIPDTQEVYISKDSDTSFILEVLELVTEDESSNDSIAAIKFHWKSLLQDVSALSSNIISILPSTPNSTLSPLIKGPTILYGNQVVSKFNLSMDQADKVRVFMALWRIESKNIDLVLVMNVPFGKIGEEGEGSENELVKQVEFMFLQATKSLIIEDFSLFA